MTLERFNILMHTFNVSLNIELCCRCVLALWTLVRFGTIMHKIHMQFEMSIVGKGSITYIAMLRLSLYIKMYDINMPNQIT